MRPLFIASVCIVTVLAVTSCVPDEEVSVYVVHGIAGRDVGLAETLPVDVVVNGTTILEGFTYGQIAGPLSLPSGTYNVKIALADAAAPGSGPVVIEADVPFDHGQVAAVIAHLAPDGTPTASKFDLDLPAAADGSSRLVLHHTAAAPAVDIDLAGPAAHMQELLTFETVPNGTQGAVTIPAGDWDVSLRPAGGQTPILGPQPLTIDTSQAYLAFAVGSLETDSLTLLIYEGPLESGASFAMVPACAYVIHGIPGEDLGLAADLPVDVALNGACALTGFTFGAVTDAIELTPGVYDIKIGLANSENPCSEPAVIEASVKLAAQSSTTLIAHLTADKAPTASAFSNAVDLDASGPSPLVVHHTAAAPAVDILAEASIPGGFEALALADVTNGQQGILATSPGRWSVSILPAGVKDPVFGPLDIELGRQKATALYAVGSLDSGTFTVLQNTIPLAANIVDKVMEVNASGPYGGQFDTLIAALTAADPVIIETLSGDGEFTVFGPTDEAFAALDLTPENVGDLDQTFLNEVLLYHVALGRLLAVDVLAADEITTLQGTSLSQTGGVLTDDLGRQANIIVKDLEASNGVIHVIDAVVLPMPAPAP